MTTAQLLERCDKYLKVVNWARDRYTRNGFLPMYLGGGKMSPWVRIEELAFYRYMK